MKLLQNEDMNYRRIYMKICSIYAISSLFWIVFSDKITPLLASNINDLVFFNIVKGCVFVLITTIFLYLLMKFFLRKIMTGNKMLRKTNRVLKNREDELVVNFRMLNEKTEALEKSEKKFRSLFNNMVTGFATYKVVNSEVEEAIIFELLDINPAFKMLMNINPLSSLNENDERFSTAEWRIPLLGVIKTGIPQPFMIWDKDIGKYFKGIAYKVEKEKIAVQIFDATEQVLNEQKNEYMAYHDILTNLPNRHFYKESLQKTIDENEEFAIVLMDLDNFKDINDTLGHNVGDHLLIDFSKRLTDHVISPNMVARWGGDEFILLIKDKNNMQNLDGFIMDLYTKITGTWEYETTIYRVSCKMGISLFPLNSRDGDILIKQADMAMYKVKGNLQKSICHYDQQMETEIKQRAMMENELYLAIKKGHFVVYYQPQVDVNGEFSGVEALVRWQHPKKGMISPAEFIPVAENNGLILPLGAWIFTDVCEQIQKWNRMEYPIKINVSINLSPKQFMRENLVERIKQIITEKEISPEQITIEITETATIENPDKTVDVLQQLKKLGVKIALDDFGTGYSSLMYLKKFPFDIIKIDKSFIQDILTNIEAKNIVKTIIYLAQSLKYKTVAEGVETIEQVELLKDLGCDCFQGYYYSKPILPKAVVSFIKKPKNL
jgi:diguanylate cyclase (GGDEF)-like protein